MTADSQPTPVPQVTADPGVQPEQEPQPVAMQCAREDTHGGHTWGGVFGKRWCDGFTGRAGVPQPPTRRLRDCVEAWPDAETGAYDPRCCRFPKSCSATIYDEDRVTEEDLEPAAPARDDFAGFEPLGRAVTAVEAHSGKPAQPDAIEQAITDALVAHRVDREGPDFDYADPALLGYARAVAQRLRGDGWERRLRYRYANGTTVDVPAWDGHVEQWLTAVRRGERMESAEPGELQERFVSGWVPVELPGGTQ